MQDSSNVRFYLPKAEAVKLKAIYDATDDFAKSLEEAYRVIRERKANGGEGWIPKAPE